LKIFRKSNDIGMLPNVSDFLFPLAPSPQEIRKTLSIKKQRQKSIYMDCKSE